jgi:4-amino-4-deoxy-L-arabinose transferase-like glycosyltransferase
MTSRTATALITAALVITGLILYTTRLDFVPPYLIHDEAQGALQAHAIATTAHDLSGRLLPLYFTEPEFVPGRDPALIYVTALGLKVLPFTEAGARTPTALVAVLDVVLMFFAARALFRRTWAGVLAAIMIMVAPVHFIRGRLMLSPLYSIPFVLAWLWTLAKFTEQPTARRFIAACTWLALGMYSYLAAVVMMPLYLVMSFAVAARQLQRRTVVLAAVTVAVCLLPMAAWYLTHPERNAQIVSSYQLGTGGGIGAAIGRYAHLYWGFFDPSYLFVSGDASLINSTRTSGVFPIAFAVLLPIGLIAILRSRDALKWMIAAGFLASPVVSVISGAVEMNRVMFAIPFAVLIAAWGVIDLWDRRSLLPPALAVLLVAATVGQFGAFYRDYLSDSYRARSATWFSGNVREAARELIARAGDSPIYISQEIEWVHRFWRFYAIEAGRLDLISRTTYVRDVPDAAPPTSKLLCAAESTACAQLLTNGWRSIATVASLDGGHRYVILERTIGNNKSK